jgi:hypothetical protein
MQDLLNMDVPTSYAKLKKHYWTECGKKSVGEYTSRVGIIIPGYAFYFGS